VGQTPFVERQELARALYRAAHLTGTFTLRSGHTSTEYFDKFQFTSRPELLDAVSSQLAAMVPSDVEVLAGLQLGGVPLAAALSLKTGLPAVYVRLERKAYGTGRICEGVPVRDRVVAVVEDVVTTGGQVGLSTADLRVEGADVRYALAVVDREQGGHASLAEHALDFRALFTTAELERAAR
jgi:orotate phosphoribosyltransferase